MKPLTTAITLLLAGVGLLVLLLTFQSTDDNQTITVTVQSHVLTQSLDGNRHYMVVIFDDGTSTRLLTNALTLCPVGNKAVLSASSSWGDSTTYQLDHCVPK